MRSGLSFEQIFPIRDPASALLMRVKADCLLQASAIEPDDRSLVYAISAAFLDSGKDDARELPVVMTAPRQRAGLALSA